MCKKCPKACKMIKNGQNCTKMPKNFNKTREKNKNQHSCDKLDHVARAPRASFSISVRFYISSVFSGQQVTVYQQQHFPANCIVLFYTGKDKKEEKRSQDKTQTHRALNKAQNRDTNKIPKTVKIISKQMVLEPVHCSVYQSLCKFTCRICPASTLRVTLKDSSQYL